MGIGPGGNGSWTSWSGTTWWCWVLPRSDLMGTLEGVVLMLGAAQEYAKIHGDWTWWQRLLDFMVRDHLVVLGPSQIRSDGHPGRGGADVGRGPGIRQNPWGLDLVATAPGLHGPGPPGGAGSFPDQI